MVVNNNTGAVFMVYFAARNLTEEEKRGYKELSWDDKEVCGCYMVQFCPHDLFVNTRSDLGELSIIYVLKFFGVDGLQVGV